MIVWIVLGLLLLILGLLWMKAGVWAAYGPDGLTLRVKAGPVAVRVLPAGKKKKEPRTPPKQPERKPKAEQTAPQRNQAALLRRLIPLGLEAANSFRRRLVIDRLYLDYTAGAADPAAAAIQYGGVSAGLGALVPALERAFLLKDRRIRAQVDFDAPSPRVELELLLTLRVWQGLALAFRYGTACFREYSQWKQEQDGAQAPEERKVSHGK